MTDGECVDGEGVHLYKAKKIRMNRVIRKKCVLGWVMLGEKGDKSSLGLCGERLLFLWCELIQKTGMCGIIIIVVC